MFAGLIELNLAEPSPSNVSSLSGDTSSSSQHEAPGKTGFFLLYTFQSDYNKWWLGLAIMCQIRQDGLTRVWVMCSFYLYLICCSILHGIWYYVVPQAVMHLLLKASIHIITICTKFSNPSWKIARLKIDKHVHIF